MVGVGGGLPADGGGLPTDGNASLPLPRAESGVAGRAAEAEQSSERAAGSMALLASGKNLREHRPHNE